MKKQIVANNINNARFPRDVSQYTTINHTRDASNSINAKHYILL